MLTDSRQNKKKTAESSSNRIIINRTHFLLQQKNHLDFSPEQLNMIATMGNSRRGRGGGGSAAMAAAAAATANKMSSAKGGIAPGKGTVSLFISTVFALFVFCFSVCSCCLVLLFQFETVFSCYACARAITLALFLLLLLTFVSRSLNLFSSFSLSYLLFFPIPSSLSLFGLSIHLCLTVCLSVSSTVRSCPVSAIAHANSDKPNH